MWLFTKNGFFSIVQHNQRPEMLLVRARVKGDIEKYWPNANVEKSAGTDYLYRATLPKFQVANRIAMIVDDIDYPDYKDSVTDRRRMQYYIRVWTNMAVMQDNLEKE